MSRQRLLLVDDQNLFVECLRSTISSLAPLQFSVDVAHDAKEALARIAEGEPDIMVVDVQLPGMSGIEMSRIVHESHPNVRIVMLSAYGFDDYVREALGNGAVGYFLKDIQPSRLIEELAKLAPDKVVLSKAAGDAIGLDRRAGAKTAFPKWLLDLNLSERRILLCLAKGMRNEEIADKVNLGKQTVRNYLTTIYRKMEVETRYEAILLAIEARIKDLVEE